MQAIDRCKRSPSFQFSSNSVWQFRHSCMMHACTLWPLYLRRPDCFSCFEPRSPVIVVFSRLQVDRRKTCLEQSFPLARVRWEGRPDRGLREMDGGDAFGVEIIHVRDAKVLGGQATSWLCSALAPDQCAKPNLDITPVR